MSPRSSFFRDKSALITGASSGIGRELALQLGAANAHLTLTARRKELLYTVAQQISATGHEAPLVVQADVARDGELEHAVSEVLRVYHKLDIVIANAGFGVAGPLTRLSLNDYRRQFETNVFGVLRTIYTVLPALEKSRGHLAIVGSVSGWAASPGSSAYSMSKFALRALANAITPELKLSGIKVTLITPGYVDSDFRRVNNQNMIEPGVQDSAPRWLVMPTDQACRQMLRAIARGQREVIITRHGKLLVAVERFAPWVLRAVGNMMVKKGKMPRQRNWERESE